MYLMSLFNNLVLNKTINLHKKRNFFNGLDIFRERRMISWLLDDMPYNPFLSLCFQICYCLFLNTHEQAQKQLISVISPCQKWLSFPQAVVLDGCADVWGWKRWQSQPGPVGGGDSCYCPQLETEVSPAAESSAESAEASQNSQHMNIPTGLKRFHDFVSHFLCWKHPKVFEGVYVQTTDMQGIQWIHSTNLLSLRRLN